MSKKYIYTVIAIIALFSITSCSDFLNVTPRDKKVVKTIEDHRDILASYMYHIKTPDRKQIKIMGIYEWAFPKFDLARTLSFYTGESTINTKISYYFDQKAQEYNQRGVATLSWMITEPYVWDQYYQFLGPINMLIKEIATAEGDDEDLRNYVQGEAIVWRVYSYFKLLQYYSPYQNDHYGIPMYLDPSDDIGTAKPKRLTQTQVFEQLLLDCNRVLQLLKATPTNEWNFAYRADFVHAMMASIYHWKAMSGGKADDDWQKAKQYAEKAIGKRDLIQSEAELKLLFDSRKEVLQTPNANSECYIRISDNDGCRVLGFSSAYYPQQGSYTTGVAARKYIEMFKEGDKRKKFYFLEKDGILLNDKYNLDNIPYYLHVGTLMPFRLAEMILIKAEAECRMGNMQEAAQTLNGFKQSRYNHFVPITGSKDEILKEIIMERKREFYIENDMMWLEMKRTGERLEREINGEKHVLEADDYRYAFPIPAEEMKQNKNMEQNPGWENIIQNN